METLKTVILVILGWGLGLFAKELQYWITRWWRGPKLNVEFDDGEDCVTQTRVEVELPNSDGTTTIKMRTDFFARLRVTNIKPRIARGCRAYLVDVEELVAGQPQPTIFSDSIPLVWSYNAQSSAVDFPKDVKQYVDVVRIQSDLHELQPQFRAHDGKVLQVFRYDPIFKRLGTLRFTILVAADELPPEKKTITVAWDGNWSPKAKAE